jgi:hypothetical protein
MTYIQFICTAKLYKVKRAITAPMITQIGIVEHKAASADLILEQLLPGAIP